AGAELLFAGCLGDAQIVQRVVALGVDMLLVEAKLVRAFRQAYGLAAGEDLMPSVFVIPLGQRSRHMHLLDDVAPDHAGVISAEADLAFLCGVRNDALLGPAEVVVVEILKPHAGDEQEVPAISAALLDIVDSAIARDLAVFLVGLLGRAEGLIELLEQV